MSRKACIKLFAENLTRPSILVITYVIYILLHGNELMLIIHMEAV